MSVRADEVARFARLAARWWHPDGPMAALHDMVPPRIGMVQRWAPNRSVRGLRVLDVGCGAGLLSEPLARLGAAQVRGVDATAELVDAARAHAPADLSGRLEYRHGTAEDELASGDGPYDVVVCSEVAEHVAQPDRLVGTLAQLVRPDGGALVVTTINRTVASRVAAIWLAERVLGLAPPGTHSWDQFVTPEELKQWARPHGLGDPVSLQGWSYLPVLRRWIESPSTAVNYAIAWQRASESKRPP